MNPNSCTQPQRNPAAGASRRRATRLTPLALAAALALCTGPAQTATVIFAGPTGGLWSSSGSWIGGLLPGSSDDVQLGSFDSELNSVASTPIRSFAGTGAIKLSNGALQIGHDSSIGTLNMAGGTFSGAGALNVGILNLSGGSFNGSGTVTASSASSWTSGTVNGVRTVNFNGGLTIGGGGGFNAPRTLNQGNLVLAGNSNWVGNTYITLNDSATLTNNGSFQDLNTSSVRLTTGTTGTNKFVNNGSFIKSGGTNASTLNIAFTNAGSVAVNKGTLILDNGGGGSGSLDVASGATLEFSRGTFNMAGAALGGGSGTITIDGNATVDLSRNWANGQNWAGQLNVAGKLITAGNFTTAGFKMSSSGSPSSLTGFSALTVTNAASWWAGTLGGSGSADFSGGLAISTNGAKTVDGRHVIMDQASSWTGNGDITIANGASLIVQTYSTFDDQNSIGASLLVGSGAAGTLYVGGTYLKSGAGTTIINTPVNNAGALALSAGTMNLNGLVSGAGSVNVASGATLNFGSASTIGSLNLAGTLGGAAALNVDGPSSWTAGTMKVGPTTTFNGQLAISGSATKTLDARSLILAGSSTWSDNGAISVLNGSMLTNNGSFDDQNSGPVSVPAGFTNNGSYLKSGTGTTSVGSAFFGNGKMLVSGGTLNLAMLPNVGISIGSLSLNGGELTGAGALNVGNASSWTDGRMSGPGSATFNQGLAFSGASMVTDGRSLNLAGASSWSNDGVITLFNGAVLSIGGSFEDQNSLSNAISSSGAGSALVIKAGASYTKSGAGTTSIAAPLTNNGTLTVNNGLMFLGSNFGGDYAGNGRIAVGGTGTLVMSPAADIGGFSLSGGRFFVLGPMKVSGTSTWTAGELSSGGSVSVNGLAFSGAGTKTLSGANLLMHGPTTWSGNGVIAIASGSLSNFGSFDDQNAVTARIDELGTGDRFINESGGTYSKTGAGTTSINAAFTNNGALTVSKGTLALNAAADGNGVFSVTSSLGTLAFNAASTISKLDWTTGNLSGTGALTVTGPSTWTGGKMLDTGSTSFSGGLTLSGAQPKDLDHRSVTLAGTTTWSGGPISFTNDALLTNTGIFEDRTTSSAQFTTSGPGNKTFVNKAGASYTKYEANETAFYTGFTNDGTVAVSKGTLSLNGTVSGSGRFSAAIGATLAFNAATTLDNKLDWSAGTLAGTGVVTVAQLSTWSGGAINGSAKISFNGGLNIRGASPKTVTGRLLELGGASSWTDNAGITANGGITLISGASFADQNTFDASLSGGASQPNFTHSAGASYTKSGTGKTTISGFIFTNSGTLEVSAGTLDVQAPLSGASFTGNSLTGGSYIVRGFSKLKLPIGYLIGNSAAITLDGSNAGLLNANNDNPLKSFGNNNGSFTLLNGATFTQSDTGFLNRGQITVGTGSSFTSSLTNQANATLQMAGGTFNSGISNAGTVSGYGTLVKAVTGIGTVRVNGGVLTAIAGINSANAPVIIEAGATLAVEANSTVKTLDLQGGLNLGTRNVSVAQDYINGAAGSGNAFNRRAGVTGSGQILATGSVQQTLSGNLIQLGNTANAVLALPSMRVGDTPFTTSFTINNVGNGASLRGAIQTGGITSSSLSGSGVTAQNWGAVAAGGSSGGYNLSYTPTGASTGLTGQSLAIVNNFDNVAGQTLSISGGKVYAPAMAQLGTSTLDFGIVHVGDAVSAQGITVSNAATTAALNDVLRATATGSSGFAMSGSLNGLAAGQQDSSLQVKLNTAQAGVFNGAATLAFFSQNADMSDLGLGSQQVALTAQVNHYAELGLGKLGGAGSFSGSGTAYTLNFGTLSQGANAVGAELMIGNLAPGLADLLSLKFDLGTASSHFSLNGFGDIAGLAAGDSQGGLQIGFNGLLAGHFDEVITLHAVGSNAGGYVGALADVQLHLVGDVAAVPELASWAQFTLGLVGMMGFMARRRLGRPGLGHARR